VSVAAPEDPAGVEDAVRPALVPADEVAVELGVGVAEEVVVGAGVVVRGVVVCCTWVGAAPPVVPVETTAGGGGRTAR
jgi:hypothetical protein